MKDIEIKEKALKKLKQNLQLQRIDPLIGLLRLKIKGGIISNAYWDIPGRDIDTVTHLTSDEFLKKVAVFNSIPRLPEMRITILPFKHESVVSVRYKKELIDIALGVDITTNNAKEYLQKQDLLTNAFIFDPDKAKLYYLGGAFKALEQKQATLIEVYGESLDDRLKADPIKLFKPIKAAVEKEFTIDEDTKEVIKKNAFLLEKLFSQAEGINKLIINKHFNTDYAAEYLKYDISLGLLPYLFKDESLLKLVKDEKLQNIIKEELGKTKPKLTLEEIEAIVRKTEEESEFLEKKVNKCVKHFEFLPMDTISSKQVSKK